jgi:hypothetical protein
VNRGQPQNKTPMRSRYHGVVVQQWLEKSHRVAEVFETVVLAIAIGAICIGVSVAATISGSRFRVFAFWPSGKSARSVGYRWPCQPLRSPWATSLLAEGSDRIVFRPEAWRKLSVGQRDR